MREFASCSNCKFGSGQETDFDILECRRYPPVYVPFNKKECEFPLGRWPLVGEKNFCGEWEVDPEELKAV